MGRQLHVLLAGKQEEEAGGVLRERDRRNEEAVQAKAAPLRGGLHVPPLPRARAGGRQLPPQADGALRRPVLNRKDHLHKIPDGGGVSWSAHRA